MNSPAVSFLVQAEPPKGEESSDFNEIETMLTFFGRGSPWSFLIFDQLPCFLYDMRYPDSAGCTKNEEEPNKVVTDTSAQREQAALESMRQESARVRSIGKRTRYCAAL